MEILSDREVHGGILCRTRSATGNFVSEISLKLLLRGSRSVSAAPIGFRETNFEQSLTAARLGGGSPSLHGGIVRLEKLSE